jgi:hypothetical protein
MENIHALESLSLHKTVSIIKLSTKYNKLKLYLGIIEEYVTYLN